LKVAFDENIAPAMVRVFQILASEKQLKWLTEGLTVQSAKDFTPRKGDPDYRKNDDVPWIKRFAEAGGQVIISGNTAMKKQPHERLALGSVEIWDSRTELGVIQTLDGQIRFKRRPVGEDGTALPWQGDRPRA
jgi:hypothetical protein